MDSTICSNIQFYLRIMNTLITKYECIKINIYATNTRILQQLKNRVYYLTVSSQNFVDIDNPINAQNKYDSHNIFMNNLGKITNVK
jgi:hypothetical protein